ncbi:MAG TPA: ribosome biogenesis GTP-binding protein YihA/YsxC [Gammaproteobacteria bacterium]|nr:ribosome biogenesis GTP-binding protein YihA/YsxC [Gammaproteobacteria bacterium]
MNYNQAKFVTSAQKISQLPASKGEVAFAGRSNAGKSSAINTITNINGLARTSKTPGRTQLLNYFEIAEGYFLVDLPGYGYAKVSHSVQKAWEKTLSEYIETREQLRGLVIIMDIRHPLTPHDQQMIKWVASYDIPMHILLTKADKLNRGPANNVLLEVRKALAEYGYLITVQLFSSLKGMGIDDAKFKLNSWFAES